MTVKRICHSYPGWVQVSILAAWLASAAAFGAAPPEPIIVTSASKQFVVRGAAQTSLLSGANPAVVYADPALLVMVCERVRDALREQMGWERTWRDAVFINIHRSNGRKERAEIRAIPSGTQGWRYRIEMPDELPKRDFVQPLIGVLLLEYANRAAHEESVELPLWLVEGMTDHLMAGPLAALALQPNTLVVRNKYYDDAGPALRARIQESGALTVDELNWPEFDEADAKAQENYRTSAHLFVRELLRLRDGPANMSAMLALLPENLNWQTAFLRAFESHFTRMLDAEKWWSLIVVQTRLHERNVVWPRAEALTRLEEILYTPMQVRVNKNDLPIVSPVGLQTLVNDWAFQEQEPILRAKAGQLLALRVRVPPDLALMCDEYRGVIENYLAVRVSKKLAQRDPSSRAVKNVLKKVQADLTGLDERRSRLNTNAVASPNSGPEAVKTAAR